MTTTKAIRSDLQLSADFIKPQVPHVTTDFTFNTCQAFNDSIMLLLSASLISLFAYLLYHPAGVSRHLQNLIHCLQNYTVFIFNTCQASHDSIKHVLSAGQQCWLVG
jgi:hypothetical protein